VPRVLRCIDTPPGPEPKPARGFDTAPKTRHSTAAPTWAPRYPFQHSRTLRLGYVAVNLEPQFRAHEDVTLGIRHGRFNYPQIGPRNIGYRVAEQRRVEKIADLRPQLETHVFKKP